MAKDVAPLEGFPEPYGLLSAILQDATADWRMELWYDFGPEVATWRVRPEGQSIGAIILHMICVELYWIEQFALDRTIDAEDKKILMWDEIDVDSGKWPTPPAQPIQWYFELQDRYRARVLESIKSLPAADSLIQWGEEPVTPRWVFGHVIQHESYHGGQIVMLYDLWKSQNAG
jgi:uncharacterized damage-inducible protein DinB